MKSCRSSCQLVNSFTSQHVKISTAVGLQCQLFLHKSRLSWPDREKFFLQKRIVVNISCKSSDRKKNCAFSRATKRQYVRSLTALTYQNAARREIALGCSRECQIFPWKDVCAHFHSADWYHFWSTRITIMTLWSRGKTLLRGTRGWNMKPRWDTPRPAGLPPPREILVQTVAPHINR